MTFTITCDKCSGKQTFSQDEHARGDVIDMEVGLTGGYTPYPNEITLFCENTECRNTVDLKY